MSISSTPLFAMAFWIEYTLTGKVLHEHETTIEDGFMVSQSSLLQESISRTTL